MNRIAFLFAAISVTMSAAADVPSVSSVSFSPGSGRDAAVISYTLENAPAVVTVDVQTNALADGSGEWTSIGGISMGELQGDANRLVSASGRKTAAWLPGTYWQNNALPAAQMRVVVKAWETNSPPDYLVVNLTGNKNDVRFYVSTNDFPGGFSSRAYKTTKLVMRKIPAKNVVWLMGSPARLDDANNATTNSPAHRVMLTYDYYAGIYELTQSQYVNIGGVNESKFADEENADVLPAEKLSYATVRGAIATYKWATNGHSVDSSSPIGKLREKSGIADMDFPTEAEWEYACRAGSSTELYSDLAKTAANVRYIAWTRTDTSKTKEVGTKPPNAWGLYDTIGNVWEFCLDASGVNSYLSGFHSSLASGWQTGGVTTDPKGANNTSGRVMRRGGSWYEQATVREQSASDRTDCNPAWDYSSSVGATGCRIFCSVGAATKCAD